MPSPFPGMDPYLEHPDFFPGLHDRFIIVQIVARLAGERLVTLIEVLSLSNKTPGARGRDLYKRKQQEALAGEMHLVEIDLLRGGEHATSVPREKAIQKTGPFDYHVCVHRFDSLEHYFVYPIQLPQRLPKIAIPLLPADGRVVVDLQAVFDRCYEAGPYRRRLRYHELTPSPPLPPDRAAWAAKCLAATH